MVQLSPEEATMWLFFKLFAQVEFSLKEAGFHNGDNKPAKANWRLFGDQVTNTLPRYADIHRARTFLETNPPGQQMVRGKILPFEAASVDPDPIHNLLQCVRRVRNNLFHGGKINDVDRQRNAMLLAHSLTILEACQRALDNGVNIAGNYRPPEGHWRNVGTTGQ